MKRTIAQLLGTAVLSCMMFSLVFALHGPWQELSAEADDLDYLFDLQDTTTGQQGDEDSLTKSKVKVVTSLLVRENLGVGYQNIYGDLIIGGNQTIGGTLTTNNINIAGTVDISGAIGFSGNLNLTGDANIAGDLTVSGTAQLCHGVVGDLLVDGSICPGTTGSITIAQGDINLVNGTAQLFNGDLNLADGDVNLAAGDVNLQDGNVAVAGAISGLSVTASNTMTTNFLLATGGADFSAPTGIPVVITGNAANPALSLAGAGTNSAPALRMTGNPASSTGNYVLQIDPTTGIVTQGTISTSSGGISTLQADVGAASGPIVDIAGGSNITTVGNNAAMLTISLTDNPVIAGLLTTDSLDVLGTASIVGLLYQLSNTISPNNVLYVQKGPITAPNQFNTVASALAAVTGNSATNLFEIRVAPGIYAEPTLTMLPYVSLVGDDQATCIIQASSANQNIIIGATNSTIKQLTFNNPATILGSGYAMISYTAAGEMHIWDCNFGSSDIIINQTGATLGSFLILKDIEFLSTASFTTGIKITPAVSGMPAGILIEDALWGPTAANITDFANVAGPGAFFHGANLSIGSSYDRVGSTFLNITDGALCRSANLSLSGFDTAIYVPLGVAPGPMVTLWAVSTENNTLDINIQNPFTTGAISGSFDTQSGAVQINPAVTDFSFFATSANMGGVTMLGPIYTSTAIATLTNISPLINDEAEIGIVAGGTISGSDTSLTVQVAAGEGYLMVGVEPNDSLSYVTWSAQNITLTTTNADYYLYIDYTGTVQATLAEPSIEQTIQLGKVRTGTTGVLFIQEQGKDARHMATKIEEMLEQAFGPVYVTGSQVTQDGDLQLDVASGTYYFGNHQYTPAGGAALTWEAYLGATTNQFLTYQNLVDYQNYDGGSGSLVAIPLGDYAKHELYVIGDGATETYALVYSQTIYTSLDFALEGLNPTPPATWNGNIAPLASIIVTNTTNPAAGIAQIVDQRPIPGFVSNTINNTSPLNPLIYLTLDGTRVMDGHLQMGNNDITNAANITANNLLTVGGGANITGSTNINNSGSASTVIGNSGNTTLLIGNVQVNNAGSNTTTIGNIVGGQTNVVGSTNINTSNTTNTTNITTIGNTAGPSTTTVNGTVNINLNPSTATTTLGNSAGPSTNTIIGITTVNTTGAQTTTIGNGASATNINGQTAVTGATTINTSGNAVTTIGNDTAPSTTNLYGTTYINPGTGATYIGNNSNTTALTGPVTMTAATNVPLTVTGNSTTAAVTVNGQGTAAAPALLLTGNPASGATDYFLTIDRSTGVVGQGTVQLDEFVVNGGQDGPVTVGTLDATSLNFITDSTTRATFDGTTGLMTVTNGETIASGNLTVSSLGSGVVIANSGLLTSTGTTDNAVQIGTASGTLASIAVGANNTALLGTGSAPLFGQIPNATLQNSSITLNNGSNISITGSPISLGGAATINLVTNPTIAGSLVVTGTVNAGALSSGSTIMGTTLTVVNSNVSGTETTNNLQVTGTATIANLALPGTLSLNNLIVSGTTTTGNLQAANETVVNSLITNLTTIGNVTITDGATITGAVNINVGVDEPTAIGTDGTGSVTIGNATGNIFFPTDLSASQMGDSFLVIDPTTGQVRLDGGSSMVGAIINGGQPGPLVIGTSNESGMSFVTSGSNVTRLSIDENGAVTIEQPNVGVALSITGNSSDPALVVTGNGTTNAPALQLVGVPAAYGGNYVLQIDPTTGIVTQGTILTGSNDINTLMGDTGSASGYIVHVAGGSNITTVGNNVATLTIDLIDNPIITGTLTTGNIDASAATIMNATITNLTATMGQMGNVVITGTTTTGNLQASDATIGTSIINNLTATTGQMSNLVVTGTTTSGLVSATDISSMTLSVVNANVSGTETTNNLNVTGIATIANLELPGTLTLNNLVVTGTTTTGNLKATDETIGTSIITNLTATTGQMNNLVVTGTINSGLVSATDFSGTTLSVVNSNISGTETTNNLNVTGTATIANLELPGTLTLNNLVVTGTTTTGNLQASYATIGTATITNLTATVGQIGTLSVTTAATVTGVTNINTTGSAATSIGTSGTGAVNIGNTANTTTILGSPTNINTSAGVITAIGASSGTNNINGTTNIAGATNVNIGSAATATTIGNSLSATTITGPTNINTSGTATTSVGTAGGATNIGSGASTNTVQGTTNVTGATNVNTSGNATTALGNAASTTSLVGQVMINTTGTVATTIGNIGSVTDINSDTVITATSGIALTVNSAGNTANPAVSIIGNSTTAAPALRLTGNPTSVATDDLLTIDNFGNVKQSSATLNTIIFNGGQAGPLTIGTTDATNMSFITDSSTVMTVAANGQIGIGTTAPYEQVVVAGSVPSLAGSVGTDLIPQALYVQGRYAYVVNYSYYTLQIFDVSNPGGPVLVGSTGTGGNEPISVYVQGCYAYVTNFMSNTLSIIDISNPASPTSVGTVGTDVNPQDVYVQGRYAYVVNSNSSTLQIIDVSNPASPLVVGDVGTGAYAYSVYVQGRYAYVVNTDPSNSLQIFDVSNPASPTSVGSVGTDTDPEGVYVQGRYAYVVNNGSNTLQIFDISNPTNPLFVGTVATDTQPISVYVQGRYAYVVNVISNTLQVFDVSNPAGPVAVTSAGTGSVPLSVYVQGRYAYVLDVGSGTLQIFDVGGAYIQQLEAGGIEVGTLQTRENMTVNNDFDVKGGAVFGQGFQATGASSISTSAAVDVASLTIVGQSSQSAPALTLVGSPSSGVSDLFLTINPTTGVVGQGAIAAGSVVNGGQTGPLIIGTTNDTNMSFITDDATIITISANGQVAIGSGTLAEPTLAIGSSTLGLASPATNELALVQSSTARLLVDTTGSVSYYSRYKTHAYLSTDQTITSTSPTTVVFNSIASPGFDINSNFNTTTGTYTAPITGYYLVAVNVGYTSTTAVANNRSINFAVNGTALSTGYATQINTNRANVEFALQTTELIQLNAGQTLTVQYTTASAASTDVLQASHTHIDIHFFSY